jgi:squalene-hopene/tetraprenyl-beta-curcumene cyclase
MVAAVMVRRLAWCLMGSVCLLAPMAAAEPDREPSGAPGPIDVSAPYGPDSRDFEQTLRKAVTYLRSHGQAQDGSFSGFSGPGVTAIVTTGLLRCGLAPQDPTVAKSLDYLERFLRDDGGIYQEGSQYRNYETCLAINCFAEANVDGRYQRILENAEKFVKQLQWNDDEGHDRSSTSYGGAGYGKHNRPDLSNTSFLVDALVASGNGPDDEAIQQALVFVSRCQNLESEHNTTEHSSKVNDGGFYYSAAAGGSSQAGETPHGGLRSYGSMTYAGLKSMIYAGVGPDDPRVKAALNWIQRHYTVQENPGLGNAGLYYYFHTFAKALAAMDEDLIEDAQGQKHDWRRELVQEITRRQLPNGSWVNQNGRWLEGDPNLVTGYTLLALSYCRPASPADVPAAPGKP